MYITSGLLAPADGGTAFLPGPSAPLYKDRTESHFGSPGRLDQETSSTVEKAPFLHSSAYAVVCCVVSYPTHIILHYVILFLDSPDIVFIPHPLSAMPLSAGSNKIILRELLES